MPKKNIFDFSSKNGLCHFSRLVVPYLHTKNKKNCGWAAVTDIQTYRGHLIGSSPPGGPIYRFGNLKICFKTIELFPIWPRLPYFLQQISFHECKENLFFGIFGQILARNLKKMHFLARYGPQNLPLTGRYWSISVDIGQY